MPQLRTSESAAAMQHPGSDAEIARMQPMACKQMGGEA